MSTRIRRLIALLCAACGLCAAACNTTKGFGQDVEKAGEGLQNSAEKHGAN